MPLLSYQHRSLTHHAVSAIRGFNAIGPSVAIIRYAIITLITTVISSTVFHSSLILISIAHCANFIRGRRETAPGRTKTRPVSHLKGLCSRSSIRHNVVWNLENQIQRRSHLISWRKTSLLSSASSDECFLRKAHQTKTGPNCILQKRKMIPSGGGVL